MKENMTGNICDINTDIKKGLHKKLWWENLKKRNHIESLGICGNICMDYINQGRALV
jgi:hypothetical protein